MKADGTGDIVQHVIVRIQSDGKARRKKRVEFVLRFSKFDRDDGIRTYKPDGSTVNTPVDDAYDARRSNPRSADVLYLKEKHLPVRVLRRATGSNISSTPSLPSRASAGTILGAEHFLQAVVLEQSLTLAALEKTYVQVYPNHKTMPVTRDRMQVWT